MYSPPLRLRPLAAFIGMASIGVPALWAPGTTHAGGFALIEHGASGMGNAYAGAAAVSRDGSTVWFNPAGMSELEGTEAAVGLHLLSTNTDWTDEGSSLGFALGGGEVSGSDTEDVDAVSALPNIYFVTPITEKLSYGVSFGVPFGSSTDYDEDWKGRYTSTNSGIQVLDFNPALSYKVSEKVSVGFGVSVQQLTADLGTAVDSGAVCLSFANTPNTDFGEADCFNAGLVPGNQPNDSQVEIDGDSVAFGFNIGALFLPVDGVKIGLAYRHGVDHELDGDADFDVNPALRALLDNNTNEQTAALTQSFLRDVPATAEVELPATFSISGAWQVNNKVQFLSDLTWTGWSSFDELRVEFETDNPAQTDSVSIQDWNDVWRFSTGINYQRSGKLILRAGYAFDEEAIPSAQRRTARIPGNDRHWLSLGFGYQVTSDISFDLGYAHLFLDDTPIDNRNEEQDGAGTFLRGVYEPSVDILSAQINWAFN